MCGAILLLPQYVFMAWFLVKHRDNFTSIFFTFYDVTYFYFSNLNLAINNNSSVFISCIAVRMR